MTVHDCDPNDWPLVAWVFIAMAGGGQVSVAAACVATRQHQLSLEVAS